MSRQPRVRNSSPRPKKSTQKTVASSGQFRGLGSLEIKRFLVAQLTDFRDLQEMVKGFIKVDPEGTLQRNADEMAEDLRRFAHNLALLQRFVPKSEPDDEALSIIESFALDRIIEMVKAVENTSLRSLVIGRRLGDHQLAKSIETFRKIQAQRARDAKAKQLAESPKEKALGAALDKHLLDVTGTRNFKDAESVHEAVNRDLVASGHSPVSKDVIYRRLKKRRAL